MGIPCSAKHARQSSRLDTCSRNFSVTNYISGEKTRLDRLAVPGLCTVVSHPYSAPHHEELSLSFLISEEDLHLLIATKHTKTSPEQPVPIQPDTSLHSVVSPDQSLPAYTNTYSKQDTSFSLAVKINVLLVENLAMSTFKVIPLCVKHGIL
jgi:hypothetical protein